MFLRSRWAAGCVLTTLVTFGCSFSNEPRSTSRTEAVRFRLGAEHFGAESSARAVAQIGDEARSVLVAPEMTLAAEVVGARLEGGRLRVPVTLAPAAVGLPDAAFVLSLQAIPEAVANVPNAPAGFLETRAFKNVERFELVRESSAASQAEIVFALTSVLESDVVNLRLHALLPTATSLRSDEFVVPPEAKLEFGYGLAQLPVSSRAAKVRFNGSLSCNGAADAAILDDTLTVSGDVANTWHEATAPLPAGGKCRLELHAQSLTEDEVRGAVWSVPRVVAPSEVPPGQAQSVIVISLDTLRADHLSGYGYSRATSPNIDEALIARGTTFADASTTFPRTDIAHLALFTGLFPDAMPTQGRLAAATPIPMLTEALRDAGFATAAFTEDALIAGSFGFWFGFDRFVERSFDEQHRGERTFADAARYVAEMRDQRFFLFLHTYKTHHPYVSSADYAGLFHGTPDDAAAVPAQHREELNAYDRTIREADRLLGDFLDELQRLGLAERTTIVLLSDHGEAFGEHGPSRHGSGFQQEQLHVPLVFRGPGIPRGKRFAAPVSLVDVAPTVLDLLGVKMLPQLQGTSLASSFTSGEATAARPLFFSWMGASDAIGMRRGSVKMVRASGHYQLFDLGKDPQEKHSRAPDGAEIAQLGPQLQAHVDAALQHREAIAAVGEAAVHPAPVQPHVEESLRALGYL